MQLVEPALNLSAQSRPRAAKWHLFAIALASGVLAAAAMWFSHSAGRISPVWLGNAVVLSVLLGRPREQWPLFLFCAMLGNVIASLVLRDMPLLALGMAFCNAIEIWIAAMPWRDHAERLPDFTRFQILRHFALSGMLLGPAVSGMMASTMLWLLVGKPLWDTFSVWYPADALGLAVLTPLLVSLRARQVAWLFSPAQWRSSVLWLSGTLGVTALVFSQNRYPILFLCIPAVLGCVFSMGLHGALLAVVLGGALALWLTLAGHGPMMLVAGDNTSHMLLLQGFILTCVLMIFPVAATLAERQRLEARLRQRETRFRMMTESSDDMTVLLDKQRTRVYVSPAARALYGCEPAQLLGLQAFSNVHPDDLPHIEAAFEALNSGDESASSTYRIKRLDSGEWQWIDALYRRMQGREFSEVRYLLNLRDGTQQKEAQLALEAANKHLITLASMDGLTRVANRHTFDLKLTQEWQRTIRSGGVVGLLFIDVDHFKLFNDQYGHPMGDQALYQIAQTIEDFAQRPEDLAARYGGEEFAVILPDTDIVGCFEVAERIRKAVLDLRIPHGSSDNGQITISIGAACMYPLLGHDQAELVKRADTAVYQAKATGRNRVSVAG
ncbi:sensor domain-containing diguanylate cyclase [Amantichitinum ursilacus]|uniref:diguanylate cyclase n=1 Tax=Amantichitinum ursilacus TaxID=857265 RepID=A0A0N0GQT0_9NEIS|nr:GGDEF domain-containing protein [Amantichitinum ursilacus]KPC54741.1 Phytochrome-like protein cph2 [Amantichitinum ursilacus]